MTDERVIKLTDPDRRTLKACLNNAWQNGHPQPVAALYYKVEQAGKKLYLDREEYTIIRKALNEYRNARISNGMTTEGADATLLKLLNAKRPFRFLEIA